MEKTEVFEISDKLFIKCKSEKGILYGEEQEYFSCSIRLNDIYGPEIGRILLSKKGLEIFPGIEGRMDVKQEEDKVVIKFAYKRSASGQAMRGTRIAAGVY